MATTATALPSWLSPVCARQTTGLLELRHQKKDRYRITSRLETSSRNTLWICRPAYSHRVVHTAYCRCAAWVTTARCMQNPRNSYRGIRGASVACTFLRDHHSSASELGSYLNCQSMRRGGRCGIHDFADGDARLLPSSHHRRRKGTSSDDV